MYVCIYIYIYILKPDSSSSPSDSLAVNGSITLRCDMLPDFLTLLHSP